MMLTALFYFILKFLSTFLHNVHIFLKLVTTSFDFRPNFLNITDGIVTINTFELFSNQYCPLDLVKQI
jgi:hypothetical protein